MNILYFSNSTSTQGGAELNLLKICNHFKENNEVKIILPNKDGIYESYLVNGHCPIIVEAQRPSLKNGKYNLLKFFVKLPYTINKIRKTIIRNNIDIVHTNDIIDFPAMIAAKLTKAKLVSHLRFIIKNESLQKAIFRKIYLLCADRIICVSSAVKRSWFPNISKAIVVYNGGPNLDSFKKEQLSIESHHKFRIVTVGKLVSISGHENIIKALVDIKDDIKKNIVLTIVGGSVNGHEEYEKMLHDLVSTNNLQDIVTFVGYTPDVNEYLNRADLFCFTPTWEHAFPTVVLEAMAMELPIIAYDKGGIKEQMETGVNGFLVNSIPELSEKIVELIEDKELLKKMGNNSLNLLKKRFSLEKHFRDIDKIYVDLYRR